MERVVNAKDFASMTGFPVAMIRRMCYDGTLPCWHVGRTYLLAPSQAMQVLEAMQEQQRAERENSKQTVEQVLQATKRKGREMVDYNALIDAL